MDFSHCLFEAGVRCFIASSFVRLLVLVKIARFSFRQLIFFSHLFLDFWIFAIFGESRLFDDDAAHHFLTFLFNRVVEHKNIYIYTNAL